MDWDSLGLLVDHLLLPGIAFYLLLKALVLRRNSEFGRSLARNNVAMGLAYIGAVLSIWVQFFASSVWRWSIRVAILITAHQAALQLVRALGGWGATWRELEVVLREEARWIALFLLLIIGALIVYTKLGWTV